MRIGCVKRRSAVVVGLACAGLLMALALPAAAQQIDTLNPSIAKPGETVTIKGQGFLPGGGPNTNSVVVWDQTVTFGGSQVVSQTEITFQVPNNADCGPHDVQVENFNPSGTSSAVTLDVFCLESVSPSQGSAGLPPVSSPTTVTVNGGGFTDDRQVTLGGSTLFNPGSEVQINGQTANTTFVDSQTLKFDVPAGLACGSAQIQVVDPPLQDPARIFGGPSPLRSNTRSFTVNQPCGSTGGGGGGNQAPNINSVTANPSNPSVGQSVSFTVGVSDPEGDALSYDWDFGDGTTTTGLPVSHTYNSAGSYTVTLTVRDGQGNSTNATTTVQVGGGGGGGGQNQPPAISNISASPQNPNVGDSVTFTAQASDPDGDPLTYIWDFDDGTTTRSSNASQSHRFTSAGSYTVVLTVRDGQGHTQWPTATATVQVGGGGGQNQPPNAGFSVSTSSPSVGQSVQFTNNSSDPDNDPLSFQWDFGDGNSSSNTSPTHTYSSSGSFTVQLTVTDGAGNTDTASQTINVQSSSGGGGSQSGLAQYDTNGNCVIDQSEFLTMINDWVDRKISQSLFFDGINAWIDQTDICAGSSSVARRSMEDVHVQSRPTASGVQFVAEGAQVQAIDVEVFGLNGQTIAERRADRAWLAWNLTTDEGARIANGVYLYRVTVHGPNGNVERTDVRKLTVLR